MSEFKDQPLHASTSEAVTDHVRVEVESQFAPERSRPSQNHWFFYYTVRITNEGEETVQLLSRHWLITDAIGRTEDIRGPGVVGEQPVLAPGESFKYHVGLPPRDLDRRDAWDLPDGDRRRQAFRCGGRSVRSPRTAHGALMAWTRRHLTG